MIHDCTSHLISQLGRSISISDIIIITFFISIIIIIRKLLKYVIRDHSFGVYPKIFKQLTLLTLWYVSFGFLENYVYVPTE